MKTRFEAWVRFSVFASLLLGSAPALATGPDNIQGLTGRLGSVTCRQAFRMSEAEIPAKLQPALDKCNASTNEVKCRAQAIRKLAYPAPNAVLSIQAVKGGVTFQVLLRQGSWPLLNSVRLANHADGVSETFLMFYRAGMPGDALTIETGALGGGLTSVPYVFVPVPRRGGAEIYFFVEGCPVVWETHPLL